MTLLADDEWGKWSDREIARHAKVSHEMVRKIRADLTVNVDSDEVDSGRKERTYKTRHGTVAAMQIERIGRQPSHRGPEPTEPRRAEVWTLVESHVAGLCSLYLAPEDIIAACPDRERLGDLGEMCSHSAELLWGVVKLIGEPNHTAIR
jgi:hypothetical protein